MVMWGGLPREWAIATSTVCFGRKTPGAISALLFSPSTFEFSLEPPPAFSLT